jgi:hypothetical protein
MEVVRQLTSRPDTTDMLAIGLFVVAALYALLRGTVHTVILGVAFAMIVLGALPRQKALAFLVGASAILLVQTRRAPVGWEGFEDASGAATDASGATTDVSGAAAADASGADQVDASGEEPAPPKEDAPVVEQKTEGFSAPIHGGGGVLLPDNRERREPLVLGKPYKLPSEQDDKGMHLDAGTTFLNAYKALKPDQISAMTRDTQELLATQKSLVAMLDSFGPLLKDMGKITGFFGGSQ